MDIRMIFYVVRFLSVAVAVGLVVLGFVPTTYADSDREQQEYEAWKAKQKAAEGAAGGVQSGSETPTPSSSRSGTAKISIELVGSSLVPPPRTITDITAVLNEKRKDQSSFLRDRAIADQEPPASENPNDLAEFYHQRGRAAQRLGRSSQELADLRKALDYARQGRRVDVTTVLVDLGAGEFRGGNYSRSFTLFRERLSLRAGGGLFLLPAMAALHAMAGDLEAADETLENAGFNTSRLSEIVTAHHMALMANARAIRLTTAGRFSQGEAFHREAVEGWSPYKDELYASLVNEPRLPARHYAWFVWQLAENLRRQGRLVEAELEARKGLLFTLNTYGRYAAHTAFLVGALTDIIFDQGRYAEAETLARANVEIYEAVGASPDSVFFALSRSRLADSLVAQGHWRDAVAEYEIIREAISDKDPYAYRKYLSGNVNWAVALIETGQPGKALAILEPALEQRTALLGEKHYDVAEVRGFLAMTYAAPGDRRRALAEFEKAIAILLVRSRQAEGESGTGAARDRRLLLILEAYIGLLSEIDGTALESESGIDAAAEAFRLADVARGRSVQRALAATAARAAAGDPALAGLARREQDAQKQISALFGLLANISSRPTTEQDPKVLQSLRAKIDQLRSERATLAERIEKEFPDYWNLINPQPVTVEQTRKSLRPGESLIATYVGSDRTLVWALSRDGPLEFASSPTGREDVEEMVAFVRATLAPNAQTLGDIPPFDLKTAHELYRIVLEPVQAGWQEAQSLLVVAHGALGQLPFSLLPIEAAELGSADDVLFARYRQIPWLARTHAVAVLPNVASLVTLRELPSGAAAKRPFVGFGDPYFSESQAAQAAEQAKGRQVVAATVGTEGIVRGLSVRLRSLPDMRGVDSADLARLARLPDTADEIRGMALAMNADLTKEVFLGAAANEHQVKSMDLSGYRVIAFATHGLVPGDLNGLTQPALALSAPQVAGVEGDGLLTMGEILGLHLDADWVVLSACNTAAADGAGAEAVSGLGRAFFYAGSRALLVSNWPVETTSARALTTDVFKRQAADTSLTRAEALRQTMLFLIDGGGYVDAKSGETVFSYAHPIFWAPFTLVGDGG